MFYCAVVMKSSAQFTSSHSSFERKRKGERRILELCSICHPPILFLDLDQYNPKAPPLIIREKFVSVGRPQ